MEGELSDHYRATRLGAVRCVNLVSVYGAWCCRSITRRAVIAAGTGEVPSMHITGCRDERAVYRARELRRFEGPGDGRIGHQDWLGRDVVAC